MTDKKDPRTFTPLKHAKSNAAISLQAARTLNQDYVTVSTKDLGLILGALRDVQEVFALRALRGMVMEPPFDSVEKAKDYQVPGETIVTRLQSRWTEVELRGPSSV